MTFKRFLVSAGMIFMMQQSLNSKPTTLFYDNFSNRYFTYLYNFEYNNVESMLDSIDSKHKLENHLYKANYYFWRTISGDSTSNYFSLCKQELNQQLILNKTAKLTKVENVFLNSITTSYLMRLELNQNNLLNGIKLLDNSIGYFEKALDNKDNYEQFFFLSGLYNYFMAYTSEKYPVFNIYLNLYKPGDKIIGIKQLKKCTASENMVIKTESIYFLLKIYLNTEKNFKSAKYYAEILLNLYPDNIIYHREYYLVLLNMNLQEEAKKEKDKILILLMQNNQLNNYQRDYFKKILN